MSDQSDVEKPESGASEAKSAESGAKSVESAAKSTKSAPEEPKSAPNGGETDPQEAASEATPKPLPKEPRKGVYTLEQGDTPGIVSIRFYGRSHKANELVKANPDCDWQAGSVITLI